MKARTLIENSRSNSVNWIACQEGKIRYEQMRDGRYLVWTWRHGQRVVDGGSSFSLYLKELERELGGRVLRRS